MSAIELGRDASASALAIPDGGLRVWRAGWLLTLGNPRTRSTYAEGWARWYGWCVEAGVDPARTDRTTIDAYLTWLADVHGSSAATVSSRFSALRSWFGYLCDECGLDADPTARVKRRRAKSPPPRTSLDTEGVRALFVAASNPRQRLAFALAALVGLRATETCTVRRADVTAHRRGHTGELVVHGKGGSVEVVGLPPLVMELIAEAPVREDGKLVGGDRQWFSKVLRSACKRVGIRPVGPHAFRHWFVTTALEAGVPLHVVQDGARHADPRTTQGYNRARHQVERHPSHTLAGLLATAQDVPRETSDAVPPHQSVES